MSEDLIHLPDLNSIKDILEVAKRDIAKEIEADPDLIAMSRLLFKVIESIEQKIASLNHKTDIDDTKKIDLAAHLNFLQCLLEDFFYYEDEEFDEDFEDDQLEISDER